MIKFFNLFLPIFPDFIDFPCPLFVFVGDFFLQFVDGFVVVIFVVVVLDDEVGLLFGMVFLQFFEFEGSVGEFDFEFAHFLGGGEGDIIFFEGA